MQIPRRKSEELAALRNRNNGPLHLTPEGIEHLKDKLTRLKKSLPELIAETQRTADYGDRSENAEYKDAKATLRRTHRQIFTIEDQLKRAVVIKSPSIGSPSQTLGISDSYRVVELGSTVVLESKDGIHSTFRILGSFETSPEKGFISYKSPLGEALINHKEGDIVAIKTPRGLVEYRIIEIR